MSSSSPVWDFWWLAQLIYGTRNKTVLIIFAFESAIKCFV